MVLFTKTEFYRFYCIKTALLLSKWPEDTIRRMVPITIKYTIFIGTSN